MGTLQESKPTTKRTKSDTNVHTTLTKSTHVSQREPDESIEFESIFEHIMPGIISQALKESIERESPAIFLRLHGHDTESEPGIQEGTKIEQSLSTVSAEASRIITPSFMIFIQLAKEAEKLNILNDLAAWPDLQTRYLNVIGLPIGEVVSELYKTLTAQLIGYATGVTDRAVRRWSSGTEVRRRDTILNLQVLLTALRLLLEVEKPKVASRWFANCNSMLDEKAPAEVLHQDPDHAMLAMVIRAAAAYAEDGY